MAFYDVCPVYSPFIYLLYLLYILIFLNPISMIGKRSQAFLHLQEEGEKQKQTAKKHFLSCDSSLRIDSNIRHIFYYLHPCLNRKSCSFYWYQGQEVKESALKQTDKEDVHKPSMQACTFLLLARIDQSWWDSLCKYVAMKRMESDEKGCIEMDKNK